MTNEQKQLLLKDLCARLLYGVILHITYYDIQNDDEVRVRDIELGTGNIEYCFKECHWIEFKPYLRPMSSMTKEERKYYNQLSLLVVDGESDAYEETDWLNEHHFDYRGLIPMGLALEAPEGMYKTE